MNVPRRFLPLLAALAVSLAAGVWLRWDALSGGFHGDDYVQLSMLAGRFPVERSVFDLYRFADIERDGRALIDAGYLPWWSAPDLRIAMFRPLSSLLLAVDYQLFGTEALGYHLHSMLWWGLVLGAAALVLFQVLPAPAASFALFLFAIDESHSGAVAWVANRATSVATFFALLGVWLHLRYRDRWGAKIIAAEALLFGVALLGAEYALSTIVFVVAYELVGREDDERQRVRAMLPALVPIVLYLGARSVLGFGVRSSGFYIDPIVSPRAFVHAALERVPILVSEAVLGTPARAYVDAPAERSTQIAWGIAALVLLALLVAWLRRATAEPSRSAAAWLALGAVLAAIPSAGALPEDRLLVASSLAVSGIAGLFAAGMFFPSTLVPGAGRWGLPGVITLLALYVHVLGASQRTYGKVKWFSVMAPVHEHWSLDADIPDDPEARVLFLSAADFTTNANLPWVRDVRGHSRPRAYRRLAGTTHVQEIRRTADDVIEVFVLSSDVAHTMAGSLYRSERQPLRRGQRIEVEGMTAEALALAEGSPWRTRFTFDRSLDDPSFVLLHAMPDGFRRVKMPAVGDKVRLPYPAQPPL
jgi:hypothetical protein